MVDPADVPALMLAAARGDADAQLLIAEECRSRVVAGDMDQLFGSMEGVTYARMAAMNGRTKALPLLARHTRELSCYCASAGAEDMAADHYGHAMAIMEIMADHMPLDEADGIRAEIDAAAERNPAQVMEAAKFYRALWAPLIGVEAFA